jgi:hypothetical protein
MAVISEKNTRRYRVQFTMSRTLHQAYEASLERASSLNVVIDFSRDFEKWFSNQLEQVARELQQLEDEQARSEAGPTVKQTSGGSATQSVIEQICLEGGADHGDAHE